MKKTIEHIVVAVFAAAALAQTAVAGDIKAGKVKAQTCLGCHGIPSYTNVYPTYRVPRLSGQHADYIVAALQAYKSGARDHGTMVAQAHRLKQHDMADIAAYFASLESAPADPQAQIPVELQTLMATCVACHGNDGNSPISLYPKIAGQHQDYLYRALLDYKTGKRTNAIMNGIVAALDEQSMKALSHYFAARAGLGSIRISNTSE